MYKGFSLFILLISPSQLIANSSGVTYLMLLTIWKQANLAKTLLMPKCYLVIACHLIFWFAAYPIIDSPLQLASCMCASCSCQQLIF